MKAHVGGNGQNKLIHSVEATVANVHDARVLPSLLNGEECRVYGEQAYRGQEDLLAVYVPKAMDFTNQRHRCKGAVDEIERMKNRTKSKIRARVEHVFTVMKLKFGITKVRCRGSEKNAHRLNVTAALTSLYGEEIPARVAGIICPKGRNSDYSKPRRRKSINKSPIRRRQATPMTSSST